MGESCSKQILRAFLLLHYRPICLKWGKCELRDSASWTKWEWWLSRPGLGDKTNAFARDFWGGILCKASHEFLAGADVYPVKSGVVRFLPAVTAHRPVLCVSWWWSPKTNIKNRKLRFPLISYCLPGFIGRASDAGKSYSKLMHVVQLSHLSWRWFTFAKSTQELIKSPVI